MFILHTINQLAVDIIDQLTIAQDLCDHQPMVETQDLRTAFARRLHEALDEMPDVRGARGRNVDLFNALSRLGGTVTKQGTHKWLSGASIPEKDHLILLADWLSVRPEWLEYGRGEKYEQKSSHTTLIQLPPEDLTQVPVMSARAEGGTGTENPFIEVDRHIPVRNAWLAGKGLKASNLEAIHATGRSMNPTIMEGDLLLVDKSKTEPKHGAVFILNGVDGVIVKRLARDKHGRWGLSSDNPAYKDRWLGEDDEPMLIIGEVVWRGGKPS